MSVTCSQANIHGQIRLIYSVTKHHNFNYLDLEMMEINIFASSVQNILLHHIQTPFQKTKTNEKTKVDKRNIRLNTKWAHIRNPFNNDNDNDFMILEICALYNLATW